MSSALVAVAVAAGTVLLLAGTAGGETSYSPPPSNGSYESTSEFNDRGLGPFYSAVRSFMRGIQKKDPFPSDELEIHNGSWVVKGDASELVSFYAGIVSVVAIGLLLALLTPVVALVWWCCGCCCGTNQAEMEALVGDSEEGDSNGKRTTAVVAPLTLGAITCVIIAGALIALVANSYVGMGISNFPERIRTGVSDVQLFIDNASEELNTLTITNYMELSIELNTILQGFSDKVDELIESISSTLPLQDLDNVGQGLLSISKDMEKLESQNLEVQKTCGEISQVTKSVKTSLQEKCKLSGTCPEVTKFCDSLPDLSFPPIPDLTTYITALNEYVSPQWTDQLKAGREQLDSLESEVRKKVMDVKMTIKVDIKNTGDLLESRTKEIQDVVDSSSTFFDKVDDKLQQGDKDYIEPYNGYRNYGFIVFGLLLLLIGVTCAIGLLYGWCSSDQSYKLLKIPVWLVSLTITIWMLVTTALFLSGLITDRACELVKGPEGNVLTPLLDDWIEKANITFDDVAMRNVSYYITSCRANRPLYEILDLASTKVNIEQILTYTKPFRDSFNEKLKDMKNSEDDLKNLVLLPNPVKNELDQLKKSPVASLNVTLIIIEIASGFKSLLEQKPNLWADQLDELAVTFKFNVSQESLSLRNVGAKVEQLTDKVDVLLNVSTLLDTDIKLGHTSFPDAVQSLVDHFSVCEQTIKTTAPNFITEANVTANKFIDEIDGYINRVVEYVEKKALLCGPLIRVYDATVVGVCDDVFEHLNGVWASAGLSLLLSLPAALLAALLASQRPLPVRRLEHWHGKNCR